MARHAPSAEAIERLDPVWSQIREEAEGVTETDPSLGGFIFATILNYDTLEQAVSHRVAQRLGNADVCSELIVQAFEDALEEEPEIGAAMRADITAVYDRDPACSRYLEPVLYFKGFQAIQTHRMAHRLWKMGRRDFAFYLQSQSSQVFGVDINPAAVMGRGIMIDHAHAIVIGETAVVEDDVSMLHSVTLGGTGKVDGDRHPKVRRGVLIGAGAEILGNIEIGACSRVAAGSVVLHDVPPNRTVAGVPAKVVGYAGCSEPSRRMDHRLPEENEGEGDDIPAVDP
ncbi:serine O-acetyltransferase [Kaustia mangrovi]|uniref:Serine acetyltransferase n=1 Tax=Kaustia mangrovi TaxID=2593653 RepID=A0A7S8HA79_9HYPH|nr:serine O-acetyltransferase [Kaustia mangrovi]QPC41277.1 serine O-acetyltransferase [Kaustia mangrovi]